MFNPFDDFSHVFFQIFQKRNNLKPLDVHTAECVLAADTRCLACLSIRDPLLSFSTFLSHIEFEFFWSYCFIFCSSSIPSSCRFLLFFLSIPILWEYSTHSLHLVRLLAVFVEGKRSVWSPAGFLGKAGKRPLVWKDHRAEVGQAAADRREKAKM